jgi:uncharacterized phage infection (PIP) family protein YhgE
MLKSIKPLSQTTTLSAKKSSADEQRSKFELFGSKIETTDTNKRAVSISTSRSTGETMNVLNETHQQLQQRGEKLSQLSDRSTELSTQASEFARMAKQLNERQKSRWF